MTPPRTARCEPGTFDARVSGHGRCRRLLPGVARASQPSCLHLPRAAIASVRLGSSCSALAAVRRGFWPLLTPACPSGRLSTSLASQAGVQVSQGKTHDLRPIHPPHLRPLGPGDIGLQVVRSPRPPAVASYAVRVPRAGTLPTASFPPTSRCCGYRSARGSCHQGPQRTCTSWSLPVRLSPRGYLRPCRGVCAMPGAPDLPSPEGDGFGRRLKSPEDLTGDAGDSLSAGIAPPRRLHHSARGHALTPAVRAEPQPSPQSTGSRCYATRMATTAESLPNLGYKARPSASLLKASVG